MLLKVVSFEIPSNRSGFHYFYVCIEGLSNYALCPNRRALEEVREP
jgi:hypothetical protein